MPCGGVPVDQTAEPLAVTLSPPAAGFGLKLNCTASVPEGAGEAVVAGGKVGTCTCRELKISSSLPNRNQQGKGIISWHTLRDHGHLLPYSMLRNGMQQAGAVPHSHACMLWRREQCAGASPAGSWAAR